MPSCSGVVESSSAEGTKAIGFRHHLGAVTVSNVLLMTVQVLMFVNINPVPDYASESACSLNFATRCRCASD